MTKMNLQSKSEMAALTIRTAAVRNEESISDDVWKIIRANKQFVRNETFKHTVGIISYSIELSMNRLIQCIRVDNEIRWVKRLETPFNAYGPTLTRQENLSIFKTLRGFESEKGLIRDLRPGLDTVYIDGESHGLACKSLLRHTWGDSVRKTYDTRTYLESSFYLNGKFLCIKKNYKGT